MPTVTSEVDIANLALLALGNDRQLTSLDEANKAARLCKLRYPVTRDATLQAHPWNEAIRRVDLAVASGITPPFEYTYAFLLPSDCLRVIRTEDEAAGLEDDYRIETISGQAGRYLLSNNATVAIEYIARIVDVALYSPLLVDAMVERLAAEIGPGLSDSTTLVKAKWDIYQAKLAEARSMDAQEGSPRQLVVDTWINARV